MRLGVFGGTFNPVHFGHLRAAEEAFDALGLEKVLFVPAGNPPLKDKGLADAGFRMQMVRLALEGNPHFLLSDVEATKDGKSYTVNTLDILAGSYPGSELVFIMGIDAFREIHLWKDTAKLLAKADFAVLSRPGMEFWSLSEMEAVSVSSDDLSAIDSGGRRHVVGTLASGRRLDLLRITDMDVSATMLRDMVRQGRSIRYLLPESVESFIMSNGLYSDNNDL